MRVTYQEFAERIGVTHGTVKRWALEGLPVDRGANGKARYPTVDLVEGRAWVQANRGGSVAIDRVGLVYFVVRDNDGAVKIGWTSDIERRFQEIRKEWNCSIQPLLVLPGGKPLELALHDQFQHLCIGAEWFAPANEIVQWIEELVPVPLRPLAKAKPRDLELKLSG